MLKMLKGIFTYNQIKRENHVIDSLNLCGEKLVLYEDNKYGDEELFILVNESKGWYTFTREDIMYTIDHLYDEYYLYSLFNR